MGHAHLLARRADIEAALPVEPVRAGLREAVRPAVAAVELGDQAQPAVVGRVEVAGQLGDLGLEFGRGEACFVTEDRAVHEALRVAVFIYSTLPEKP